MLKQDYVGVKGRLRPAILQQIAKYRLHTSDESRLIEKFFIALDTPISLSCYMLYRAGEFDQLVSKDLNPHDYVCPYQLRDDFAAVQFLRKNETLKTSFQLRDTALLAFKQAEVKCKESNQRLKDLFSGRLTNVSSETVLLRMARKIELILGDFDVDMFLDLCSFGPGVTLAVKGDDTSNSRKFDVDCDITADAYDLFGEVLIKAYPLWENLKQPHFKTGNTIITVPKNAKTDRTIAIEPGLNSWIQLGIGKLIRKRLRSAGYDLNSNTKNQRGAYLGSLDGVLATLDFKAASDTISTELVRLLLPPKWFVVLNAARSHYYTLDKVTVRSEKFSTMGNGFTFELESLIFLTLGLVVNQILGNELRHISIFGDDLVVPSSSSSDVATHSEFMGFTLNLEKSFSSGNFRESCGSYYFCGVDVKPLYLKKGISRLKDVYRFANALTALAHRRNNGFGRDSAFQSLWSLTTHLVPIKLRLLGPVDAGDAAIHVDFSEQQISKPHKNRDGKLSYQEGFTYSGLIEVPIDVEKYSLGLLLSRLNKRSISDSFGNVTSLRAKTRIAFKRAIHVSRWYNYGPWL
jgi:hypothetical protein